MSKLLKILLVEDDPDDVDLLREALYDNNVLYEMDIIKDGGLVAPYLQKCTSYPDIIVLDFNLPRVHGRDLMKLIKQTYNFKNIPLYILTTSSAQKDIDYAYREGASKYLIKPTTVQGINDVISILISSH
jgi:CheY-like chemotaxis protein